MAIQRDTIEFPGEDGRHLNGDGYDCPGRTFKVHSLMQPYAANRYHCILCGVECAGDGMGLVNRTKAYANQTIPPRIVPSKD